MRKLISLLIVIAYYNVAIGQNSGYCLQEKSFPGQISLTVKKILGKKDYTVDYTIDMCYTGNEELVVKISKTFQQKGNELVGKKLEKSQQNLWVDNISLNGDKEFYFKVSPGTFIDDNFTYVVAPNRNVQWENKSIILTHQFRYEAEGQMEVGEITCAIPVGNGSTIEQIVAQPETIVVEKIVQEPQRKTIIDQPEILIPEVTEQNYNCIDSVAFYFRRTLELYNQLSTSQKANFELTQARTQYEEDRDLFELFAGLCKDSKTSNYQIQFQRVSLQLNKIFSGQQNSLSSRGNSNSNQTNRASNNQGDFQNEDSDKKGIKINRGMAKNPLRYLLGGLIGLAVIAFFIFKYGKKIVKKGKKRR